jgi:hypothetical protein
MIKLTYVEQDWYGGSFVVPNGDGVWAVVMGNDELWGEYSSKEEADAEALKQNSVNEIGKLIANEVVDKLGDTLSEIIWSASEKLYDKMKKCNNGKRETKC